MRILYLTQTFPPEPGATPRGRAADVPKIALYIEGLRRAGLPE